MTHRFSVTIGRRPESIPSKSQEYTTIFSLEISEPVNVIVFFCWVIIFIFWDSSCRRRVLINRRLIFSDWISSDRGQNVGPIAGWLMRGGCCPALIRTATSEVTVFHYATPFQNSFQHHLFALKLWCKKKSLQLRGTMYDSEVGFKVKSIFFKFKKFAACLI